MRTTGGLGELPLQTLTARDLFPPRVLTTKKRLGRNFSQPLRQISKTTNRFIPGYDWNSDRGFFDGLADQFEDNFVKVWRLTRATINGKGPSTDRLRYQF
jgi:hypothetical protein